jgi:hypothetical protein
MTSIFNNQTLMLLATYVNIYLSNTMNNNTYNPNIINYNIINYPTNEINSSDTFYYYTNLINIELLNEENEINR